MTLQQLEYVVALDNHRHFVTAANSCLITQPTLTMQLKKLEDEIGVQIFDRNKKPLSPTIAGEAVVMQARQILREVARLKEFVSNETESIKGRFSLGVIPTVAPYLLPRFLPDFIKQNPHTKLIIKELQTEEIIKQLKKGTLDLGLLATPLEERSIREVPLYHEPFLLYLPPGHAWTKAPAISPALLHPDEMLLLEEGHCFREQALTMCGSRNKNLGLGFEFASGSIEALKGLVDKGIGYTLVPELTMNDQPLSDRLRRFKQPEPSREISLVVHSSFAKEALIERLRDCIMGVMPERFQKAQRFTRIKWK